VSVFQRSYQCLKHPFLLAVISERINLLLGSFQLSCKCLNSVYKTHAKLLTVGNTISIPLVSLDPRLLESFYSKQFFSDEFYIFFSTKQEMI